LPLEARNDLFGRERVAFERTVAPRFLPSRRWFGHKETSVAGVSVRDFAVLRDGGRSRFILPLLDVKLPDGGVERYFAPLAAERSTRMDRLLATPLLGCGAAP